MRTRRAELFKIVQAAVIFNYLNASLWSNAVGGWNLIAVSLSVLALYFEVKEA